MKPCKTLLLTVVASVILLNSCAIVTVPPGQIKKQSAPGQVKKRMPPP